MTAHEEIKAWMEGNRDYSAGAALLKKYGKNKVLAQSLAKKR